jgi:hypothetical protein
MRKLKIGDYAKVVNANPPGLYANLNGCVVQIIEYPITRDSFQYKVAYVKYNKVENKTEVFFDDKELMKITEDEALLWCI